MESRSCAPDRRLSFEAGALERHHHEVLRHVRSRVTLSHVNEGRDESMLDPHSRYEILQEGDFFGVYISELRVLSRQLDPGISIDYSN